MKTLTEARLVTGEAIRVRTYDADGTPSTVEMVYGYAASDGNPLSGVKVIHGIDRETGEARSAEVHVDGEDIEVL